MGQATAGALVTALGLVIAGLGAVLYQLIQQQGRLLLRLEQVEGRLGLDAGQGVDRGTVALQARNPAGLAVGTPLPDDRLPDLDGREVSLHSFLGRRVLLVHWSARCGFCEQIAPDLAAAAGDLERAGVVLLLVSHGPAAAERELVREHGLDCPILLLTGTGLAAFAHLGTPAAYLLDEEGRVAAPLALGADQVPALLREVLPREGAETRQRRLPGERPLSASRIERGGLKVGTPAPAFELPEVRGGTVSLAGHRGRKVLLVFSDPHCGPCDELAPHLARIHAEHRNNGLDLVLVGRGDPEENRRKAAAHGYEFPVALQRRWEVSRQYGIFAAPVGFLIDENGVIAKGVAMGVEEIVSLAQTSPADRTAVAGV